MVFCRPPSRVPAFSCFAESGDDERQSSGASLRCDDARSQSEPITILPLTDANIKVFYPTSPDDCRTADLADEVASQAETGRPPVGMYNSSSFVAKMAADELNRGRAYSADLDAVSEHAAEDAVMREFSVRELARMSGIY